MQQAFKQHAGLTPMAYVRRVRLSRAHDELGIAHPRHTTVADVAHRWGFSHLGRFAAAYRAIYHTTPSQTLRGR